MLDLASSEKGCCMALAGDLRNCSGAKAGPMHNEACAQAQCAANPTKMNVWKHEDYNHHPYTCCHAA